MYCYVAHYPTPSSLKWILITFHYSVLTGFSCMVFCSSRPDVNWFCSHPETLLNWNFQVSSFKWLQLVLAVFSEPKWRWGCRPECHDSSTQPLHMAWASPSMVAGFQEGVSVHKSISCRSHKILSYKIAIRFLYYIWLAKTSHWASPNWRDREWNSTSQGKRSKGSGAI